MRTGSLHTGRLPRACGTSRSTGKKKHRQGKDNRVLLMGGHSERVHPRSSPERSDTSEHWAWGQLGYSFNSEGGGGGRREPHGA